MDSQNRKEESKLYTCPMHPDVHKEHEGLCPECGMKLVPARGEHERYADKHAGHDVNIFRRKFWLSLVLTIPAVLYSDIAWQVLKIRAPEFSGSEYVPFIFGSVVFFYGGWVFLVSAWRELRARMPGMMTLISIAILTAYIYSVAVMFVEGDHLFWELTTLITIMLLGHWMEMGAVRGAQGALKELSKLLPDMAEVVRDGEIVSILVSELKKGDILHIKPGSKIPADAKVIEGASEVNESIITGESRPVGKKIGNEVIAGSVNGNGRLRAKVIKIGEETFLSGIMRLIEEAQSSKSKLQLLSDKAAFLLTIIAIAAGAITLTAWMLAEAGLGFSITRTVAVLVIACPHALGLAIPLVASISTTMAAQNGFLVRQRLALEAARDVDVVLFDKTGTLTEGNYGVQNILTVGGLEIKEILRKAASVDAHSEHYVSKAIVAKAKEEDVTLLDIKDFKRLPGRGVGALVEGKEILVGGLAILDGAEVPGEIKKTVEEENKKGKTIIYVLENKRVIGAMSLADLIRDESREAVRKLKDQGVRVAMLTGDSEDVARWVAEELGIDEYFAGVLPGEKSEKVKELQKKGRKIAMVGDGINDAPALMQSDLGIAIGAGTNVAIESAGIILVRNDPRDIPKIIRLSKLTYVKMMQNLFWAAGYNVVAIPLAAGILASRGILLQPALAAVLMSVSTVIVAINAVLLRRKKLT